MAQWPWIVQIYRRIDEKVLNLSQHDSIVCHGTEIKADMRNVLTVPAAGERKSLDRIAKHSEFRTQDMQQQCARVRFLQIWGVSQLGKGT